MARTNGIRQGFLFDSSGVHNGGGFVVKESPMQLVYTVSADLPLEILLSVDGGNPVWLPFKLAGAQVFLPASNTVGYILASGSYRIAPSVLARLTPGVDFIRFTELSDESSFVPEMASSITMTDIMQQRVVFDAYVNNGGSGLLIPASPATVTIPNNPDLTAFEKLDFVIGYSDAPTSNWVYVLPVYPRWSFTHGANSTGVRRDTYIMRDVVDHVGQSTAISDFAGADPTQGSIRVSHQGGGGDNYILAIYGYALISNGVVT